MIYAIRRLLKRSPLSVVVVGFFVISGITLVPFSRASIPFISTEAETGTPVGSALVLDDSTASAGKAIRFGSNVTGTVYYVSRNGSNGDGRSWAGAWNELSNIDWSLIQPGDTVLLDGGSTACASNYDFSNHAAARPGVACGMLYNTVLNTQKSGTAGTPITIKAATEPGRNGTVVIFGGRSSMLPYCNQASYSQTGVSRSAGVMLSGVSNVVIDGSKRSGIMVYGAQVGVDLLKDATSHVTLRNMEIFDNGIAKTWAYGWKSDYEGINLVGNNITMDRLLIHDNGQDGIQDRYTGTINNNSHAAMSNITLSNSWLYNRRDHPSWAGYPFSGGAQTGSTDCTHVDGMQIWGGGLRQKNLTVSRVVFGPLVNQGLFPGDPDRTSFDNVSISHVLFVNALGHSINGVPISTDPATPNGWKISNITSYMTDTPNTGTVSHGKLNLHGSGHQLTDSVFYNGYFSNAGSFGSASGNINRGGTKVPGAIEIDPAFTGPLPSNNSPRYGDLVHVDFTPKCASCAGKGSGITSVRTLLDTIDSLNR